MNFEEMRHHLMAGVIERVARTSAKDAFVLRGGMLTRAWVAPVRRPTRDLDFVGDFAFDRDDTTRRFAPVLACELDDGIAIDRDSLAAEPMWVDSGFPGVRLELALGLGAVDQKLTIDVGFGDPLVPAPIALAFRGSTATVEIRACRPETQLAWKLHALAEMETSWRPKDLADAWLITSKVALDDAELAPAIVAAFESRGYTRARATGLFDAPHWATKTARLRWGREPAVDLDLGQALGEVRARLSPVLCNLPDWEIR